MKCSRGRGRVSRSDFSGARGRCKTRWEEGEEAGRETGGCPQGWRLPWREKEPAEGPGGLLCSVLTQGSGFLSASDPERLRDEGLISESSGKPPSWNVFVVFVSLLCFFSPALSDQSPSLGHHLYWCRFLSQGEPAPGVVCQRNSPNKSADLLGCGERT